MHDMSWRAWASATARVFLFVLDFLEWDMDPSSGENASGFFSRDSKSR